MNIQKLDILNALLQKPYAGQRCLSEDSGHSLGVVNSAVKSLIRDGYLDPSIHPTKKALDLKAKMTPKNAIILAAGFGMRMVPINMESPKALLEVFGEPLIERIIKQLHAVGVQNIFVVVGFMKEHFEYLIDLYGVKLIVNKDYASKNNLHSLKLALPYLQDSYIVPCNIWCRENPFRSQEFYSWYMVRDDLDEESPVRINRKRELTFSGAKAPNDSMVGLAYLQGADAAALKTQILALSADSRNNGALWENALFCKDSKPIGARIVDANDIIEINTYEQLRNLDSGSNNLNSDAIETICRVLRTDWEDVTNISVLKKGMTNRSFLFNCKGNKYIMRIPGEGTDHLINRREEASVYNVIKDKDICDDIIYIDPQSGYKITVFLENARVCDPTDPADVSLCMARLRRFHEMKLTVPHTFDIFKQIDFYEQLWNGAPSCFRDYQKTKEHVFSLKSYIDSQEKDWTLTHIDAVPDNFLFVGDDIRLIDWEYAGMQDPHVDIAMFCIYAMYDREHIEALIDAYFPEGCSHGVRTKIYCYIAACGLLWSNWCEYKRRLGVEFGEYSLRQYRFAKDFYQIARQAIDGEGDNSACTR